MQTIPAPIAAAMAALKEQIHALTQSEGWLLTQLTQYLLQPPGKQIRPMLVFLGAGACGGITPKAHRGAALVTLLHHATLLHDDVVDKASYRRGRASVNAKWSNQVAVLFGDYLLARVLHLATRHQDYDFLNILAKTSQNMSEGELMQLEKAHQPDTTAQEYLEIIRKKTACFMGDCLSMGATAAGASDNQVHNMQQIGNQIGMAFQIQDDLLDYSTADIGNPQGMDIQQGKFTLPTIEALRTTSAKVQKKITPLLKQDTHTPQQWQTILDFVNNSQGIAYAKEVMRQYGNNALDGLQMLEDSDYKIALLALTHSLIAS